GAERRVGRNDARRIDAGRWHRKRFENRQRARECEVRVLADEKRRSAVTLPNEVGGDEYRGCARGLEMRVVFRVCEKGQVARSGLLDSGHPRDLDARVADETTLQVVR